MKKICFILMAFVMLLTPVTAQAATPNAPTFSTDSGVYQDSVTIVLRSGSLLNTVYYEIYEYGLSNMEGELKQAKTKYTLPFKITESCYIEAWSERDGEGSQIVTNRYYIRYSSDEGRFTVDENGTLTAYTGNSPNLVIPDEVDGIPVTAIGDSCFEQYDRVHNLKWYNEDNYSNYLKTVTLPDTVTHICSFAFAACVNLTDVYGGHVQQVDNNGFYYCERLKNIDMSHITTLGKSAFSDTGLEQIDNDSITNIDNGAFSGLEVETISLPNLTSCGTDAFSECGNIKYVNLPKLTKFTRNIFRLTYPVMINAPSLTEVDKNAFYHNDYAPTGDYAPIGIHAAKLAGALGGSIRLSDSGLRFGFNWDNSTDLEAHFGENIEYGFIYAYDDTDDLMFNQMKQVENGYSKVATKHTDKDGKTSFNLVFTDIPKANYDTKISARAYIRIYNWYFYSDILTRSCSEVAQAVLADPTVDDSIKAQLRDMLS